jgi:hypothetical protein
LRKFIKWPDANEYAEISTQFSDVKATSFPGIIGAIDGTHIMIDPPNNNPNAYYNRKKFHDLTGHFINFLNSVLLIVSIIRDLYFRNANSVTSNLSEVKVYR